MARGRKKGEVQPGSRRWIMDRLAVGDSCIFIGEPGQAASRLQACIASNYRGGDSMGSQGLTQRGGLAVFEGEVPLAIVRVTRTAEPLAAAHHAQIDQYLTDHEPQP